jgi:predicted permease
VFGLAPALRAATAGPAEALTAGSKVIAGSRGRLASGLVVAEVALSLLLLVGAGLFVGTLQNLRHRDAGFQSEGVLLLNVDGPRAGYRGPQLDAFHDQLLRDVERLPGVKSASLSRITPLAGGGINMPIAHNGQPLGPGAPYFNAVGPKYFDTLQTSIVAGRDFTERDQPSSPRVAMVNEAFVKRHLSGSAIGERLSTRASELEIVGVVRDAAYESLRDAPPPTVYVPFAQRGVAIGVPADRLHEFGSVTLAVNAGSSASSVATALQRLVQPKLPGAPVQVRTFSGQIERALIRERVMATLAGGLGALALVLASVGLCGLLSYTVASRTNEIGVRMALGAAQGQVLWLVVGDASRLIALGVLLGLPAAWVSSRLVSSMLFGLAPTDPATLVGAAAVLGTSGLLASLLPARRAVNVDPMVALRHQ